MRGRPHKIVTALREERLRQGVTLEKLSEITGYCRSHLSAIERGHQGVRIEIICDLAQALGGKIMMEFSDE